MAKLWVIYIAVDIIMGLDVRQVIIETNFMEVIKLVEPKSPTHMHLRELTIPIRLRQRDHGRMIFQHVLRDSKGLFGGQNMIRAGYDRELDKDRI